MPAQSEAQRRYLYAKFGAAWVKKHHFDNKGHLPAHKHKKKHHSGKQHLIDRLAKKK